MIQERFREKLLLSVDQPRSGGAGTSTTGNVCRKEFEKPELLAKILDVNIELTRHFKAILNNINCGQLSNTN